MTNKIIEDLKTKEQLLQELSELRKRNSELEKLDSEYKRILEELRQIHGELAIRVKVRTAEVTKSNEDLQKEIFERKRTQEILLHRFEFEKIISGISTNFVNISPQEVDNEIKHALRIAGEFISADVSLLFLFSEDLKRADNTHHWLAEGVGLDLQDLKTVDTDDFSWWMSKLSKFDYICIPDVNKLPLEAENAKAILQNHGIQSLILIPMPYLGRLARALGFVSLRPEKIWDEEYFALLKIIGEILANALQRKEVQQALLKSEEKHRSLYESSKDGIASCDLEGNLLDANQPFLDMLDLTQDELRKVTYQQLTPEKWHKMEEDIVKSQIRTRGYSDEYEKEYIRKDGSILPISIRVWLIKDASAKSVGMWAIVRDISERKISEEALKSYHDHLEALVKDRTAQLDISNGQLQEEIAVHRRIEGALRESEKKYHFLFDIVPVGIGVADIEGNVYAANKNMQEMFGLTQEELKDVNISDFYVDKTERQQLLKILQETGRVMDWVVRLRRKDGTVYLAQLNIVLMELNGKKLLFTTQSDITKQKKLEEELNEYSQHLETLIKERTVQLEMLNKQLQQDIEERKPIQEALKKSEQEKAAIIKSTQLLNKEVLKSNKKLKQLALRDPHTGLFNHRYLEEVIEAEFYRARRYAHSLSLIMLDVDYFKSINDVYGYQFGDLVLKQLTQQLKLMLRRYDIIIRFSGEEFVILSPGTEGSQALVLAQRLLDALSLYSFGNKEHRVKLKLSIAVVTYPDDKIVKGSHLVELAEQMIGRIKEDGGNRVYSSSDLNKKKHLRTDNHESSPEVDLLKNKIDKLNKEANQNLIEAIFAFAKTIEVKDRYTGEHVESTVHYATEIAKALGLSKDETEHIKQAAMLHDLGKIGISEKILLKETKLSKKEFDIIKKHPQIGVDIIRPIKFLHSIISLIFYHHERWDGKGYPSGLRGEDIPIGARIIAIADVYQALISDRPYRKALSKAEAVKTIKNGAGTQFDPHIVRVFLKILKKGK